MMNAQTQNQPQFPNHLLITEPVFMLSVFKYGNTNMGESVRWGYEIKKLAWVPTNKGFHAFRDSIVETGVGAPNKRTAEHFGNDRIQLYRDGEIE